MTTTLRPTVREQRAGTARPSARALARFEMPHLLRHPGFVVGLAIAGLLIVTAGPWDRAPGDPVIEHLTWGLSLMPVTMAAAFALLASRSRRNDVEQIEVTTTGGAHVRQTAVVLLTIVPGLIVLLVGAVVGLIAEITELNKAPVFSGPYAAESLLVLGQAAVTAIAMCAFASAAGAWVPYGLTSAVIVLIVLQGADTTFHPTAWNTAEPIASLAWHLVYGAGVALLAGAVALARHRRDLLTVTMGMLGGALSIAGGALQ